MTLAGQRILVTGASRGIGASIAHGLLEGGAEVIGTYAKAPGELDHLLNLHPNMLRTVQTDFRELGAGTRLLEYAVSHYGALDGVVNNAGLMVPTPLDATDQQWAQDWATTLQVNVQAVADICRAFLKQKGVSTKRLVNVASRAAFRGDAMDYMHYAASKGAVVSLTRTIARGAAKEGVRAFTIAPGWVKTDMAAVAYEPGNEWMFDEIPVGDAAPPSDIGNLVAFLLSGKCDNSTGATFDVNGASYVR